MLPLFYRLCPWWALLLLATGRASAGLVGDWKADSYVSGNWIDSTAQIPATPVNAPAVVPNAFAGHKGINCAGTSFFSVPANRNPLGGKTSFTVAAVFQATAAGTTGAPWYNASGLIGAEEGGLTNDFGLGWTGDGGGAVRGGGGYASGDLTVSSTVQALNVTHAAALTYDGPTGVLKLYVDGALATTLQATAGAARNAAAFGLGAMSTATTAYQPFPGLIAELQIYDTVEDGLALTKALRAFYLPTNLITSYTQDKTSAYEGQTVHLAWTINTEAFTGNLSVTLQRGGATLYTGTAANDSIDTPIPDLAGTSQSLVYTLTAAEVGGGERFDTKQITVTGDPGRPTAAAQNGLKVQQPDSLLITLPGVDPNGGMLSYSIVRSPTKGSVSIASNIATFTPTAGATGADSFTYMVSDGKYESTPARIALVLNPPAAAPTAIYLDNTTVSTAAPGGAFVANIASQDTNIDDAQSYALVVGTGSVDNSRFSVVGHQLRTAQSFAGLAGQSYLIRLRATDSTGNSFEQSFTLVGATPSRGIVINEVLYNGIDNTVQDEFIELYNAGTTPVDLAGWKLSNAVDYPFPATTLAAGAYLVVAQNPATIQARFGKAALGPWTGSLSSKGETIRLRNAGGVTVSEVDYQPAYPWPLACNGDGASMELINPQLDESLGGNWRAAVIPSLTATSDTASPGVQNRQYAANSAPATRQVSHAPAQPASDDPIVVTVKATDPNGVASVKLLYQVVTSGNYIPSTLARSISAGQFTSTALPLPANSAFEAAANWTTLAMNDDGLGSDVQGGDSIYTATIPPQAHRTLVRYRIVVTDNLNASVRVPYADDPSLNFACFVYDGVPDYQGTTSAALTTLPTYHFLTRAVDYTQCIAYDSAYQLSGGTPSWTFENWEAAFVVDGIVHDHIYYRLHGANGRYSASGAAAAATSKRAFKFVFNKGSYFQGRDNNGRDYPSEWKTMVTENCWENRGTYTFSLNEAVNFYVWNALGVPCPLANFAHFRTIKQPMEQPDAWHGDFWGLMFVHEDYDKNFLDAHNLPSGNVYKLTRDNSTGVSQQRYQAPLAPKDGSDHDNLQTSLNGSSTPAYITSRVNVDLWARYHAFAEAIRHYDYWPNGDNNAAYYFYPTYNAANGNKGVLWYLPNDVDATWGPTWNAGHDLVHNSLFNDAGDSGGDSATNPTLWPRYYNQVREVRDLLWQANQINPLIDQFAATIAPLVKADFARWYNAPADAGNFAGLGGFGMSSSNGQTSLAAYVAGMKDFAFDADNNGSSWPGENVGVGGRAAYLDTKQGENGEAGQIPFTPTLTYTGPTGAPVNALTFSSSAFRDPQGASTAGSMQWRMAEVNPTAIYTPGTPRLLEINASFDSGEVALTSTYRFPAAACVAGLRYRARVRHKDNTGRWSHWSTAVEFTAGAADTSIYTASLVVSELMYHPLPPTAAEKAQGFTEDDFEYIEVRNVGAAAVDLTDVRLTKGVDFDFPTGLILNAGESKLVVHNSSAFTARYGSGLPVAGTWQATANLSNNGEELKLSYGAGTPIIDFVYDDDAGWPTEADGLGYSLVLIAPETRPNPALPQSWRPSRVIGGSPGGDDRTTLAVWALAHGVTGTPSKDDDHDGISNLVEYALGGDPAVNDNGILPLQAMQVLTVGGVPGNYLTLKFKRLNGAEDIGYHVEFSTDLTAWAETATLVSSIFQADGTYTETWRAPQPMSSAERQFIRLRVSEP